MTDGYSQTCVKNLLNDDGLSNLLTINLLNLLPIGQTLNTNTAQPAKK
jgi:hypothetical protein